MDRRTTAGNKLSLPEAKAPLHHLLPSGSSGDNFEFARFHPRFSDRTLRVIISPGTTLQNRGHSEGEDHVEEEILQLPVNSAILANQSQYFLTLFGGYGFQESDSKIVDIHIKAEERKLFLRLLEFVYSRKDAAASNVEESIGLWLLAEQFLVQNLSRACLQKLQTASLEFGHAVQIIEGAETARRSPELRSLVETCTCILIRRFKNLSFVNSRHHSDKEVLRDLKSLPQSALEALLRSNELPVEREETAFYALILWVRENAGEGEESRVRTMDKLAPLIRFPFMKADVLSGLIEHPELSSPECQKLVIEGLRFRTASLDMKQRFRQPLLQHRRFEERTGYPRPVQAMCLEQPQPAASIRFSATLEELEKCTDSGTALSYESFRLSGIGFAFRIRQVAKNLRVALDLAMCSAPPSGRPVVAELNVFLWSQQQSSFVHRFHARHTFHQDSHLVRCGDLFGLDFKDLAADRNHWLSHGQIFLSADITLRA